MIFHVKFSNKDIRTKTKQKKINFGGNHRLKIYGTLYCTFGKRMKRENRVFFNLEEEAIEKGYRPCGHCMRAAYLTWKDGIVQ